MSFFAIIGLIAWILSPFVFIPLLISMSGRLKKKDEEIRRLNDRLRESASLKVSVGNVSAPVSEESDGPVSEPVFEEAVRETSEPVFEHVYEPVVNERVENTIPQAPRVKVKEKKKLETGHILFGVGVVLVFVAGLIFATSMWSVMPSIVKVATLLIAAMFFVLVAFILETKLKLREASVTMFVLGSAFMSLTAIAIGYFAWFGSAFSLGSSSRYLVISVSLWILTGTLFFGYKLYKSRVFTVIAYISSCPAFSLLARQLTGKGDAALALTGVYMLAVLILIHRQQAEADGINRVFALSMVSRLFTLAYCWIALLLYMAFGFSEIMSLVMLICIAVMIYLAGLVQNDKGKDTYGWLYFAIPVYGAFFIFNTCNIYKYTIPHGDVLCGVILTTGLLFACRYVSIRGDKRLYHYGSFAAVFVSYMIVFANLMRAMERSHDGLSDICEVLPGLIAFLVAVILFTAEYLHTIRPLKSIEADNKVKVYMILLASLAFTGIYTLKPITRYTNINADSYFGSLIPVVMITAVMLAVILLYQYRLATGSLTFRILFTERLGSMMLNLSIVIAFLFFADLSGGLHRSYVLNIPLIAAILMYQIHIRLKHNNPGGVVTAVMFPFVLMKGLDEFVALIFPDSEAVQINTVFEIKLLMFLFVLIIGLFIYRKLLSYDKEKKRILIDWNLLMALIILASAFITGDAFDIEHISVKGLAALSVFTLYVSSKLKGVARKTALSVMTAFLCLAYVTQDYITFNYDFESELMALAIPVFAAIIHFVIFRGRSKAVSYISFGLVSVFFLIEWLNISMVWTDPGMGIVNVKLWLFLLVTMGVCVFAFIKRSLRYDITALVMILMLGVSCMSIWKPVQLMITVIMIFASMVYCYRFARQPFTLIPLVTLLAVLNEAINIHLSPRVTSGNHTVSHGILVRTPGDYGIICIIWIAVFALMLTAGRLLHKRIVIPGREGGKLKIDWFTICSVFPVFVVWDIGNEKFKWSVWLLLAIYLFGYYRRIRESFGRIILTAISVLIAIAWWTQPIIRISDLFKDEFRIIGFLALVYVISKVIYKKEMEGGLDFMYYASVASVIWQSVSAIRSARLFDVIILGIVLLAIIIAAFELKSRKWFLLSAISLVCIFLYMSRNFWRRIVWPVYVFAIGLILIIFATRNEYRKKHPVPEEEKKKFFDGWNR